MGGCIGSSTWTATIFKGTVSPNFRALVFSSNNTPLGPWFTDGIKPFWIFFEFAEIWSIFEHKNFLLGFPLNFLVVGEDNSGTYMFWIDIPFKGWQGRSNCSSIVHAVSYFACVHGVDDTHAQWIRCHWPRIYPCILCQWHCMHCACGVIDTACI
jgi:hypothetical protein